MDTSSNVRVRLALPEEREPLEKFVFQFPAIRDFNYTWRRWGNWDATRNLPVVAVADDKIVGMHAATIGKRNGYLNSYYLATDPAMRGQGLAGKLVSVSLRQAHNFGATRLKMKCHFESPGRAFWEGFGCRAFAVDDVQLWYDHDIRGADSADTLTGWMVRWVDHEPIPLRSVEAAARTGAKIKIGAVGYAQL